MFALVEQLGEDYEPDRSAFDRAFAEAIADPDGHLLLVASEASGDIVGYALTTVARLLYTNGESAQLQELVVDERARNRGVGSQLVSAVEDACRRRGVRPAAVVPRSTSAWTTAPPPTSSRRPSRTSPPGFGSGFPIVSAS